MPGESILLIDDSQAVQDIAESALSHAGYRITSASNGASSLTYPGIDEIDLIILGTDLNGLSGEETTRILKQHAETHPIPILMLIPEDRVPDRENTTTCGAIGYLLKPFNPESLVRKVDQVMDQRNLDELSRQYLADASDRMMGQLAEEQINSSVERKSQLIVEKCIQNITNQVDERARGVVEQRVTGLVSEKEQELVKTTVHEVANAMVEKLALAQVEEAMDQILRDETEKAVRRISDQILPNQIRERTKDMLNNILPREVEKQLQKSTDRIVPEISNQIVSTVENVSQKSIPRIGRELLPVVIESQVSNALNREIPRKVTELVSSDLNRQMVNKINPTIQAATRKIQRTVLIFNGILGGLLCCAFGFMIWLLFFGPGK
jgi:two-component system chemotaxis response regulator CheY